MTSAEIDAGMVFPLRTPSFPPVIYEYDPKRHSPIKGVSKYMITTEQALDKFNEYHDALGPHDEVYIDRSKINERVGKQSLTAISRLVRRLADSCPKDFQITATSLLLRLQSSSWYWTITQLTHWMGILLSDMNGQTFYTVSPLESYLN